MAEISSTYELVVGLGACGVSMARFLKSCGRAVAATDIDPARTDEARALEALGIPVVIGRHDQQMFDRAAAIIPSPGIPLTMPYIRNAMEKGVPVVGELDIFSQYNTTPVVAITGTNGKTTTTELTAAMLESCGLSCFVGGNIGTPLVEYLMQEAQKDVVVAEISSFQLDLARTFRPDVGVLLNVAEDHLDRYPDFNAYTDSKWSLFSRITRQDTAIVNTRIPDFQARTKDLAATVLFFSSAGPVPLGAGVEEARITIHTEETSGTIETTGLTRLPGAHNRENMAAAALAALGAGANMAGIQDALARFSLSDHRMAFVRELDGIRFYNDSKATNVDAVLRALESFKSGIILILGGREKGLDFAPLIPLVKTRVKAVIAMGEACDHIMATFDRLCPCHSCPDMACAVATARALARDKDVVLLSPACASFDLYASYGERGKDFARIVNALESGQREPVIPGQEVCHG